LAFKDDATNEDIVHVMSGKEVWNLQK